MQTTRILEHLPYRLFLIQRGNNIHYEVWMSLIVKWEGTTVEVSEFENCKPTLEPIARSMYYQISGVNREEDEKYQDREDPLLD